MQYSYLVFLLRSILLIYRIWHFYESNEEFIDTVKKSNTYHTLIHSIDIVRVIKDCESTTIPNILRLAENTLSPDAVKIYTKLWDISHCLENPVILSQRIMELRYPEWQLLGSPEMSNAIVEWNPPKEKSKWSDILNGGLYQLGEQTMNYLLWNPSHTPLYDKWTFVHNKMKDYSRAFYQVQYISIDISDELIMFQRKFQQAIYTTWSIYNNLGILLIDIAAYNYKGDNGVMLSEGLYLWTFQ
jgi:hypothetical protein